MLLAPHRIIAAVALAGGLWAAFSLRADVEAYALGPAVFSMLVALGIVSAVLAMRVPTKRVHESSGGRETSWAVQSGYITVTLATLFLVFADHGSVVTSLVAACLYTGTAGFFYRALSGSVTEE